MWEKGVHLKLTQKKTIPGSRRARVFCKWCFSCLALNSVALQKKCKNETLLLWCRGFCGDQSRSFLFVDSPKVWVASWLQEKWTSGCILRRSQKLETYLVVLIMDREQGGKMFEKKIIWWTNEPIIRIPAITRVKKRPVIQPARFTNKQRYKNRTWEKNPRTSTLTMQKNLIL